MPDDKTCGRCGHPWAEHTARTGCEHDPVCWCHLPPPGFAEAHLDAARALDESAARPEGDE